MSRYRRVQTRVWGDEKFRQLSAPLPNAQTLWFLRNGSALTDLAGTVARHRAGIAALKPVLAGQVPSAEVSLYLREATRCYLYGFFQGSTALCRAALEAGINELLQRRFSRTPCTPGRERQ